MRKQAPSKNILYFLLDPMSMNFFLIAVGQVKDLFLWIPGDEYRHDH